MPNSESIANYLKIRFTEPWVRNNRKALKTTTSDTPVSAAMAVQRLARPRIASSTKTAFTPSEAVMFWWMTRSVRCEWAISSGGRASLHRAMPGQLRRSRVALRQGIRVLIIGLLVGDWLSPRLFHVAAKLGVHGMLIITGVVFCFGLSWCASLIGLAPIVGAFAAGLILDEKHYSALHAKVERSMEDWVLPVTTLLVHIFFVMMGFQVDLRSFRDPQVLLLAEGLTFVAIIGKQVCSLGVIGKGIDRPSVGIGMIPRGEVGLIFAAIGQGLVSQGEPVIVPAVYSAIVVMVMVTTLVTPPLLSWSLRRMPAEN